MQPTSNWAQEKTVMARGTMPRRLVVVAGRNPIAVGARFTRGGRAARCNDQQHEQRLKHSEYSGVIAPIPAGKLY